LSRHHPSAPNRLIYNKAAAVSCSTHVAMVIHLTTCRRFTYPL